MTIILGILLALACALATNIGFIYKHRGACSAPSVDVTRPFWTTRKLYASRWFAVGMGVAVVAWLFHVAAMAVAPLSVVQPVLAGGVVLLAVMAEKMLGVRVGSRQWVGLALTAVGLILLGLTLPATHGAQSHFSLPGMIGFESGLIAIGALLIVGPRIGAPAHHHGFMLGAAAGFMFGVSDVAIKAISGLVGSAGILGLVTPWTLVTVAASVVAFFASAKGLQDGEPVAVIAVTGTAASVAGIVGGILVFGDPLPGNPAVLAVQCMAFVFVLLAAWLMPAPVRAVPALV
ncbi:MAG TPA: hypothetical protein VG388_04425 [Solirubrobacteraceae bacterium]|nr:hypothetical protein [Solirubrobacteraceae bacterium]